MMFIWGAMRYQWIHTGVNHGLYGFQHGCEKCRQRVADNVVVVGAPPVEAPAPL